MSEVGREAAWLEPKPPRTLSGDERFSGSELSVLDFWRWAFSDLRENVVRGILAEFLVARALGDASPLRRAWDNFDVTTPAGIRVEVKSSALLQSWRQRRHSRIAFSGLTGRSWSAETSELGSRRELRADVYVFAIHTLREPALYDALQLEQWEFRVLSAASLRLHGYRSIGRAFLERHAAEAVPLERLGEAIERAHAENGVAALEAP